MRYAKVKTKFREDKKEVLETTLLNKIRNRESDVFIVMVEKTRLDHLANKFYNNPRYWWVIASANGIKGTMFVRPGTQVRIPTEISEIILDHNKINN
jgi:hypothetical protein